MFKAREWCFSLFVFLLVHGTVADTTSLQKRDSSDQQTVLIPLFLDQNRYFINVTMSLGPGEQSFNPALSTGTGYTVVAGTDCASCDDSGSYNVSKSTTAQQLGSSQDVSLFGGTAGGSLIREDCHFTQSNGSAWVYNNQTIIVANQTQSLLTQGISAVVGLGTNARNGDFKSTIYNQWLLNHPGVTNFTFGMALNPPTPDSQTDGGVLHWLAPETTAYQGDLTWRRMEPIDPTSGASDISTETDWFVGLDNWSFFNGIDSNVSKDGNMIAAIDLFEPGLVFPQTAAGQIYGTIQDAQLLTRSPPTELGKLWSVPCDTKMQLTLTFDSLSVVLKEDMLVRQLDGICVGTISQWSNSSATEYFLGSAFISTVYLVFLISESSGSSIGIARRNTEDGSGNKLSGGVIAGIVLGGFAAVLMMIVLFVLWRDRRRRRGQLPDPYRAGLKVNGPFGSHNSTPISPSYPLTPRTPPGLSAMPGYSNTFVFQTNSPTTPPTDPRWDSSIGAYESTDGTSATGHYPKSKNLVQNRQRDVLVYTAPASGEDSTSQFRSSDHDNTRSESESGDNVPPQTPVRVRRRPVPLNSLPPPYEHQWEVSEDNVVSTTGAIDAGSELRSESQGRGKKKRIVMAR
ncbi:acid protease [Dendrothele bispora CBS 962.96]|uniref:Acid protease n=1 Tax=Dendrothele bispora (strain CBS 962.96) TaxID=1314807 RepID=A0A4S8LFI4_DENBC|nr:acid protease [Dendrothele bispora CBS 962.96]